MDGDMTARLIYMMLLLVAVAGWFFAENRQSMGKTAQQAAVWGLIFVGVIGAYGLWNDISHDVLMEQSFDDAGAIEIPRARDGHYYITLDIDGTPLEFVIDTGATDVVLSQQDAQTLGFDVAELNFFGSASTANGEVRMARVTLRNVQLGPVFDAKVSAAVNGGEMQGSLLGMSYLQRFETIQIGGGKMILTR